MAPVPNRNSISLRSMPMKFPLPSRRSTRLFNCDFLVSPSPTRNRAFFIRQPFTLEIHAPINSNRSCCTLLLPSESVSIYVSNTGVCIGTSFHAHGICMVVSTDGVWGSKTVSVSDTLRSPFWKLMILSSAFSSSCPT